MASFAQRPGGWLARVRRNGVSESKVFATKAQARAWATEKEAVAQTAPSTLPRKTVAEAFERYAEEVSSTKRGERWERVRLVAILRELGGPDGNRLLTELTTPVLAEWRSNRLEEVSPGSVLRDMNLVNSVLNVARKEWKWLDANPLKDVTRPKQPEHRRRRVAADELERISVCLGYAEGELAESYGAQVAVAFHFAIETAMRQGEILSLTKDAVDFEKRTAFLPKTKNGSARTVPLSSRAIALLRQLPGEEDGRFFGVVSASCDALFRKGRTRAMIDDLHFHDSRREATSRLSKKVDVLTLARITGHKDLKMLMIYYEEDMASVAQRLD